MCLLAVAHGVFALIQFHAGGVVNPFVSVLSSGGWTSAGDVPFELLGAGALAIVVLMAATSHDFWLHTLTAPVWKALHMAVYLAYALIVAHVAFARCSRSAIRGCCWDSAPARAGSSECTRSARDASGNATSRGRRHGRGSTCAPSTTSRIRGRSRVLGWGTRGRVPQRRPAVGGVERVPAPERPLGEGTIVNGCIVCPWHGYEYAPETGASPAPFTEKVPTFRVRIERGRVLVDPRPNPPGTYVEPARIGAAARSA